MTAPQSLAAPPAPRSRAGMIVANAMDRLSRSRHARPECAGCGEAWFGEVAYCPYCGRSSTSATTGADAHARPASDPFAEAGADRVEPVLEVLPQDADKVASAAPVAVPTPPAQPVASAASETAPQPPPQRSPLAPTVADPVHSHAGTTTVSATPAATRADPPGRRRSAAWKPIVAAAIALAVVAMAAVQLTGTRSDRVTRQVERRVPVVGAVGEATPAPPPRADIKPPNAGAPVPPARNRSLCSAASEAAGLCTAQ